MYSGSCVLYIPVPYYTPPIHPYTPLYTPIHPYTPLYTPVHPYTPHIRPSAALLHQKYVRSMFSRVCYDSYDSYDNHEGISNGSGNDSDGDERKGQREQGIGRGKRQLKEKREERKHSYQKLLLPNLPDDSIVHIASFLGFKV